MSITVENLTKIYGSQKAVDDISFQVKTGEILGFLGPNGAGKSTTMKIISCFISPTKGSVQLDGFDINKHSEEVRRRIGYLPENNPLYTDMSIFDYLHMSAALQNVSEKEIPDRIKQMVDVCGLGPECHKNINELSKGFRQRVGLAQALIHDPDVLILDEPTTGLDPNQIVEIRSLIKEIGKEKTVMLSSHILKEVEATCDRILIISKGKLVADGSTEELKARSSGTNRLLLQIEGEGVKEALLALDSVAQVTPADEHGKGSWFVDIKTGRDSRKEIFRLCVDRDWVLLQLTPMQSSLEDVFRKLTIQSEDV
ncbi:MAG: ATP-binding cassette domain-containing protein [Balneolaceae bacterium]|nr:ATP-binding cassette domain-containing protein [Balneolaceae bacterium]MDR9409849.1 ATP-binding cassette domain-containing protein [Balneolaceae bacterium]